MRVGLFTESYDPVINGVSTSVKTLALELARAGHDPAVVAPRFPGYADRAAEDGVEVLRLPSWRTPFNPANPFAFPPLGPTPLGPLRSARFDVVHTQQPFGMGRHGRRSAHRLGVPLVSTFHTLYTQYVHYLPIVPVAFARRWLADQLRGYYASCDAVVVPSRAAGDLLTEIGVPAERLHVVPTGVVAAPAVVPAAIELARRTYALPERAPVLLFVGRLAREKNLDLLLDAFARLNAAAAGPDFPAEERPILVLAGSGPYRDALEARVRRDGLLDGRVRFTGFLRRTDLAPLYALATLFVFPSTTETQGVVLSEAQSYSLPCVVARGGGASEFVRDGVDAAVVEPEVEPFTAAVRALLGDGARRRAYAEAALASPLRPTPADMACRLLALYESLRDARAAGRNESASEDAA